MVFHIVPLYKESGRLVLGKSLHTIELFGPGPNSSFELADGIDFRRGFVDKTGSFSLREVDAC